MPQAPTTDDPILAKAASLYQEGKLVNGTVRKWETEKGFGWIRKDGANPGDKDVFVYQKELSEQLKDRHFRDDLIKGTKVMFNAALKEGTGGNTGKEDRLFATVCVCPSEMRLLGLMPQGLPIGGGKGSPVGVMMPGGMNSNLSTYGVDRQIGGKGADRSSPYGPMGLEGGTSVRISAAQMASATNTVGSASDGFVRVDASTVRVTGSPDGQTVRITGGSAPAASTDVPPATNTEWWATFMSALSGQGQGTAPSITPVSSSIGQGLLATENVAMTSPQTFPSPLVTSPGVSKDAEFDGMYRDYFNNTPNTGPMAEVMPNASEAKAAGTVTDGAQPPGSAGKASLGGVTLPSGRILGSLTEGKSPFGRREVILKGQSSSTQPKSSAPQAGSTAVAPAPQQGSVSEASPPQVAPPPWF